MKIIKYAVVAAVVVVIGLVTAPYWGGCGIVYQTCKLGCDVRHFNNGLKKSACKAGCAADRVACQAK